MDKKFLLLSVLILMLSLNVSYCDNGKSPNKDEDIEKLIRQVYINARGKKENIDFARNCCHYDFYKLRSPKLVEAIVREVEKSEDGYNIFHQLLLPENAIVDYDNVDIILSKLRKYIVGKPRNKLEEELKNLISTIIWQLSDSKTVSAILNLVKFNEVDEYRLLIKTIAQVSPDKIKPYIENFIKSCNLDFFTIVDKKFIPILRWLLSKGHCQLSEKTLAAQMLGALEDKSSIPLFFNLLNQTSEITPFYLLNDPEAVKKYLYSLNLDSEKILDSLTSLLPYLKKVKLDNVIIDRLRPRTISEANDKLAHPQTIFDKTIGIARLGYASYLPYLCNPKDTSIIPLIINFLKTGELKKDRWKWISFLRCAKDYPDNEELFKIVTDAVNDENKDISREALIILSYMSPTLKTKEQRKEHLRNLLTKILEKETKNSEIRVFASILLASLGDKDFLSGIMSSKEFFYNIGLDEFEKALRLLSDVGLSEFVAPKLVEYCLDKIKEKSEFGDFGWKTSRQDRIIDILFLLQKWGMKKEVVEISFHFLDSLRFYLHPTWILNWPEWLFDLSTTQGKEAYLYYDGISIKTYAQFGAKMILDNIPKSEREKFGSPLDRQTHIKLKAMQENLIKSLNPARKSSNSLNK